MSKNKVAAAQIRARMAYHSISYEAVAEAMGISYLRLYRWLKAGLTANQFIIASQALDKLIQAGGGEDHGDH